MAKQKTRRVPKQQKPLRLRGRPVTCPVCRKPAALYSTGVVIGHNARQPDGKLVWCNGSNMKLAAPTKTKGRGGGHGSSVYAMRGGLPGLGKRR